MISLRPLYDKATGEDYSVEPAESRRPFRALLDVGLIKTTTGNRVFGALKVCSHLFFSWLIASLCYYNLYFSPIRFFINITPAAILVKDKLLFYCCVSQVIGLFLLLKSNYL